MLQIASFSFPKQHFTLHAPMSLLIGIEVRSIIKLLLVETFINHMCISSLILCGQGHKVKIMSTLNCGIDDTCPQFSTMSFVDDFRTLLQQFHTCFYFRSGSCFFKAMILVSSYMFALACTCMPSIRFIHFYVFLKEVL